jgi:predicted nucleotidyltransferase
MEKDREKDRVIVILREHAPELRDAGVMHLRVFGSVARGDNSSNSDIDLLADFDRSRRLTLVTVGRLESRLADLLGVKVDLSSPEWMRESIRERVLKEAVLVF